MNNDLQEFERFMKRREEASLAFVNGDIEPLDRISTQVDPATIFGPKGDYIEGANKVNTANEAGAGMFDECSENRFEIMQMAAGADIAFWTGIQRSSLRMKGKPDAVPMDLRVTEIFRREDGEWKLVHRHADTLKSEIEGTKK